MKKYKTLYEKMNSDVIKSIKADKDKYPALVENIIARLKSTTSWLELTVLEIINIENYSNTPIIVDSVKLSKIFYND